MGRRSVTENDSEVVGVLIFDGDCPFCSAASTAIRRVRGVGAIEWDAPAARSFLEAQFDDVPFALVFADVRDRRVYIGRAAARVLCERAGLPVLVGDLVGENYESVADAIRVGGARERAPDPYHGVYPLSETASDRFAELTEAATLPHLVVED